MLRAAAATPHLILFLADDLGLGDRSEHGPQYQDRDAPRLKHHTASDAEGPDRWRASAQRPLNSGLFGSRERQRVDGSPLAGARGYPANQSLNRLGD